MGSLPYLVAAACFMAWGLNGRREFRNALYTITVVGLVHVIPWIAINTRAIEIDPGLAHAHFSIGVLYQGQGELDRAARAYRQATEIRPRDALYWYHLASALETLPGNEEEARKAWRRVLDLAGEDPSQRRLSEEAAGRLR